METRKLVAQESTVSQVEAILLEIARQLVDGPDEVRVARITGQDDICLKLQVSPGDVGKIIGKQGRTARSIRTILSALGSKSGKRYTLDIVTPESIEPSALIV